MIDFSALGLHVHLPVQVVAICIVFFVAGIVKGVTGMGLPTIAMGLLGTMMPPIGAASLLILPSFVTNVWQLLAGPSVIALLSRLWLMMLGIVVGTVCGSWLLRNDSAGWAVVGLGCVLILYAGVGLRAWQWSIPPRMERGLSPAVGVLTGLITGATGVFVIPAVPYIQALGLKREDLIQALGLSFTVSTIALALGLARGDALRLDNLAASMAAVAPALLGMWLGQRIRRRISPASFRRWFFVCLLLLGIHLVLQRLL
ncbi:MAG: sulfite exporter TauE/SafE family protein [Burkholderiaceae bacterium]|nr:sulfite exporter TauE/SafE family protein [Burkholderiaceae bacterium]